MSMLRTQPGSPSARGPAGPPLPRQGTTTRVSELERERANPLGSFLRARRERITPEQAGIGAHGVRRVPGLRREEVALLAGISADYYLRLERGRDRRPSGQVLGALAAVLRLDRDETAYLEALGSERISKPHESGPEEDVPASAIRLLHALPHPAFIEDRHLDVLAANEHATALNPRLRPGRNQLRDLLLDHEEQALHPDGDLAATCLIASLRHNTAGDLANSRFIALADELHRASSRFRQLWARNDVRAQRGATLRLMHPLAGPLRLVREQLTLNGTADVKLVVYYPET